MSRYFCHPTAIVDPRAAIGDGVKIGPYAVVGKAGDTLLGVVGLWYPNDWPEPEIKWALARRHWGRGFASEAAREVQSLARAHVPDVSLISLIHPDNGPSIRVAEAIGARFEREFRLRDVDCRIYRHPGQDASGSRTGGVPG